MKTKPKINKANLFKLKSFCIAKETINKTKKTAHRRKKKIFANEVTNKRLISKTHQQLT